MANKNYFPNNLRYLRKAHKLTQVELGHKLNKTGSLINMWENDKREATLDDVRSIADMFNVSLSDIICTDLSIDYKGYMQASTEAELLNCYRSLNSEQQHAVLTMIKAMAQV